MIIKELHLVAFGKFHDKKVMLEPGFNWIHGANESGKSTLHKFVEGMLFGFFKDSPTRRVYSEEYNKYMPLRGRDYFGVLVMEHQGRTFRLERNFLKGRDDLRIYDWVTGEDRTHEFPYDSALRLHTFFSPREMNRSLFRNTISMGQLKLRTEEEWSGGLKERIHQFSHTGSDVSLSGALEHLKKKREVWGSPARKGTPLGQWSERNRELEQLIQTARKSRETLLQWADEKEALVHQEALLIKEEEGLRQRLENMEVKKVHEKYKAYQELHLQCRQWETYLEEQELPLLSDEEYNKVLLLHQEQSRLIQEILQGREYLAELQGEIQRRSREGALQVDEGLLNTFRSRQEEREKEKTMVSPPKKSVASRVWPLLLAFAGLVGIAAGWALEQTLLMGVGALVTGSSLTAWFLLRKRNTPEVARAIEVDPQEQLREAQRLQELKALYEVASFEELEGCIAEDLERVRTLSDRRSYVEETILLREEQLEDLNQDLEGRFRQWQVATMEEWLDLYQRQKRQRRGGERIRELRSTMDALMTQEEYTRMHLFFTGKAPLGVTREDGEALKEQLDRLLEQQEELKGTIHRLEGQMLALERDGLDLTDLEEERVWIQEKVAHATRQQLALDQAREKIQQASGHLHREVAPKLHKAMEEHLNFITGVERQLKVDPSSRMRVEDGDTAKMMDAEDLSMGAVDQLYLAFRLSVIETLGLTGYPLILDEAFLQFDDARLDKALELLAERWKDHQILLFTSQGRERKKLEDLGIPYHQVLL